MSGWSLFCTWNIKNGRLRYLGSGLRVRVWQFCLPNFPDVSKFTRIVSTRFPAVNLGLHVKDKRVLVYFLSTICRAFK
jgi:hypothetical protein